MSTYSPDYLKVLNDYPENFARFITRVPGIPTSTDRMSVISALTPTHEAVLEEGGIAPKMLRRAQQVHGNKVALVGDIGCSYPVEGVDGLICGGKADCCLGIYVADCAAIWIYDPVTQSRGLIHSGKLGTQQNIVGETLTAMYKILGVQASDCIAVISPCIRPPHYEVDIVTKIKQELVDAGVAAENITDSGLDTAADLESFYSYRIEKGNTGRMLALFGRNPAAEDAE
ncbi:MAG: polyphenol oxidase family protein [Akkermansia sp.]|nr:polyphenol oxidase family protein [Akkermansia sp.]MBR5887225.1 polyphenol oxidase family protein [Akkermansia sp.]